MAGPTKADLLVTIKELEAQVAAATSDDVQDDAAITAIREQMGIIAGELHLLKQEHGKALVRAEAAEKALSERAAISTDDGTAIAFSHTLVLADTLALTNWSNKASATWGVDFEGDSADAEWLARAVGTTRERVEALADGSWRLHTSNRNAAMKITTNANLRLAHEADNGRKRDVVVSSVGLRSMAMAARDASRASGVGRFSLGSHGCLSFLGPCKVFLKTNGDVLIRQD
jgi:hypothetical protein